MVKNMCLYGCAAIWAASSTEAGRIIKYILNIARGKAIVVEKDSLPAHSEYVHRKRIHGVERV